MATMNKSAWTSTPVEHECDCGVRHCKEIATCDALCMDSVHDRGADDDDDDSSTSTRWGMFVAHGGV